MKWMAKKKKGGKGKKKKDASRGKYNLCSHGACKEPHKYLKAKGSALNLCQDREHKVVLVNEPSSKNLLPSSPLFSSSGFSPGGDRSMIIDEGEEMKSSNVKKEKKEGPGSLPCLVACQKP